MEYVTIDKKAIEEAIRLHNIGNPIGVCKTCGRKFRQNYSERTGCYSKFRTCSSCRIEREEERKAEFELGVCYDEDS